MLLNQEICRGLLVCNRMGTYELTGKQCKLDYASQNRSDPRILQAGGGWQLAALERGRRQVAGVERQLDELALQPK